MRLTTAAILLCAALLAAAQTGPAFDIASIRVHDGPLARVADVSISGPKLTLGTFDIPELVLEAYALKPYQLSLASGFLQNGSPYYDIIAIAPQGTMPTRAEFRQMLQALLADRFQVRVHREQRELNVYALVVDKNGPKLQAGSGDAPCSGVTGPEHPTDRNYRYRYKNCPMERLVGNMNSDRPILDQTGLTGRYDIDIIATPAFRLRNSSEPGDVAIEDSIRRLGLKLEPKKTMVEMLVVDSAAAPSEN